MQTFILSGPLGKFETVDTKSGTKMVKFGVLDKERVNGEEKTQWFNCIAFGKRAETLEKFHEALQKIEVKGKVQMNTYEGKNGKQLNVNILVDQFDLTFKGRKEDTTKLAEVFPKADSNFTTDEIPF
tara:strand:+ start:218 stop:598 length:381 start_codon:yes stop_codon:yes gene_type:complete